MKGGVPGLGAFSGFFLGLFLAFDLFLLKVIASDSGLFVVLPMVLLVVGIVLGLAAPALDRLRRASCRGAVGRARPRPARRWPAAGPGCGRSTSNAVAGLELVALGQGVGGVDHLHPGRAEALGGQGEGDGLVVGVEHHQEAVVDDAVRRGCRWSGSRRR